MTDFEFCFADANGYVTFERRNARPLDPLPEGAVLRGRTIARLPDVPDKYHRWAGDHLEAMTAEERVVRDDWDVAQAELAESARQAAKSPDLKQAENIFLGYVVQINAVYSLNISATDSFQEVLCKIDASVLEKVDKLEIGMKLRTLWDVVLYHGGTWGDVTYHSEIAE